MTLGHVILTRFNIAFWDRRSQTAWQKPEWLEDRLRLFARYTFPSIAAQDVRSFTWLVFIHPDTPPSIRQRLEHDRAAANMELIETPFFDPELAAKAARAHVGSDVTHLVTTTLDNDDALARSFVGELQGQARPVERELINFVNGLRLVERSGGLYRCRLPSNPFVTAVEKVDAARTIWAYLPHGTILQRVREVRDVVSEPAWLQVVHDRNLAGTGAWGLFRACPAELAKRFSLGPDLQLDEKTGLRLWPENVRRGIERIVIDRLDPKLRNRLRAWLVNDQYSAQVDAARDPAERGSRVDLSRRSPAADSRTGRGPTGRTVA